MNTGCYTALITPFKRDAVDEEGLNRLIDFQIENGITGILAVGTTGESPVLSWEEHNKVVEIVAKQSGVPIAFIPAQSPCSHKIPPLTQRQEITPSHKTGITMIRRIEWVPVSLSFLPFHAFVGNLNEFFLKFF